jgi:hypothetical protein
VSGPVVNVALLNQEFPSNTLVRNTSTVWLDNPDRRIPRNQQLTAGYEREFLTNLSFRADYTHNEGSRILVPFDLNAGLRATTSRTAPIVRVDQLGIASQLGISPFTSSVMTAYSDGQERYDGLSLSLNRRFVDSWGARFSYTLGHCRNDVDASNNYQVLADQNLTWGSCANDHKQILNVSGEMEVPRVRGLRVTGTYRFISGTPINLVNSNINTSRNGLNLDNLAPGTYSGSGPNALTVTNGEGFDGAVGPHFVELDLRMGYRIRLAQRTLDVNLDTYNLTNAPNFANPSGDLRNPLFLVPTALVGGGWPRQAQINVRLTF